MWFDGNTHPLQNRFCIAEYSELGRLYLYCFRRRISFEWNTQLVSTFFNAFNPFNLLNGIKQNLGRLYPDRRSGGGL